jgi:hypothetical protein
MTALAELMGSHAKLRAHQKSVRWPLPELEMVQVSSSLTDLDAGLAAACGKAGWLRFQSNLRWTKNLQREEIAKLDMPLAGEWAEGESSWRIVPGSNGPALRHYREGAGGGDYLRETSWVLARALGPDAPPEKSFLEYAIYWDIGPDGRAGRAFDRFLGFAAARKDGGRS